MDRDAPDSVSMGALLSSVRIGGLVTYGATVTGLVPVMQQLGTTPPDPAATAGALHDVGNATLWLDGTVDRVGTTTTIAIDESQYSDVVVPIAMGGIRGCSAATPTTPLSAVTLSS